MTKLLFTVLSLCLLSIFAFDRMTIHNGISMHFLKDKFITNSTTVKQLNCIGGNGCNYNNYINYVRCSAINEYEFNCSSSLPDFLTMNNISMTCDKLNNTKYIYTGSCRLYYNLVNPMDNPKDNVNNTKDNVNNTSNDMELNLSSHQISYSSIVGVILCGFLAFVHIYAQCYRDYLNAKRIYESHYILRDRLNQMNKLGNQMNNECDNHLENNNTEEINNSTNNSINNSENTSINESTNNSENTSINNSENNLINQSDDTSVYINIDDKNDSELSNISIIEDINLSQKF